VVVVQDCGNAVEDGMVQLAESDVDAEDGREDEMEEKGKHCRHVVFMRQVRDGEMGVEVLFGRY
jgi:hypothetical protein